MQFCAKVRTLTDDELVIILIILEDVLAVDASEHDMIDAGA